MFISGQKSTAPAKEKQKKEQEPALLRVPGKVIRDCEVEWANGNSSSELTFLEIEAIKKKTGYKSVDTFRALQIKGLMASKTYSQIVRHFNGKKRYSPRTIWAIYSAIKSVGEQ